MAKILEMVKKVQESERDETRRKWRDRTDPKNPLIYRPFYGAPEECRPGFACAVGGSVTRRISREEFERRNQNACPEVAMDGATAFAEIDIDKPATHGQQEVALSTLAELLGIITPPADPWRAA